MLMGFTDALGARVGERLVDLTARSRASFLEQARPELVRLGMTMQEEFFRLTGAEVRDTIGPLWAKLGAHPDSPDWLRQTGLFVAKGQGQWATLLAGSATGTLLGGGLLDLITNELQPAIGELIRETPNTPLTPSDAAAAQIRGLSWGPDLWTDAGQKGVDQDRFRVLQALQSNVLNADQILELFNRGLVNADFARALLKRAGWDHDAAEYVMQLRYNNLSVQDAAQMRNRNIIDDVEGRRLAVVGGYAPEVFDQYVALDGVPPDNTSLILAWQRGVINESDVDRALIQGPLRNEWIHVVKELRFDPLPPTQLADAVNQGHMDFAVAQNIATQSGVRPQDFQVIVDNAGIPPGPSEAIDWLNRGLLTEDEFTQAFLESRIKNKYVPLYLKARRKILTLAEIRLLYARDAMTREQAALRLQQYGYSEEDAGIILLGAIHEKTAAHRDLTKSELVDLYRDRLLSADELVSALQAMGYTQDEAQQLVDLADMQRFRRFVDAAVSQIKSRFVTRRLDENGASAALDQLQIPSDARDSYIALWNIERGIVTKELTPAQVVAAAKGGVIDPQTALDRLAGQGYSDDDARILLHTAKVAV